VDSLAKQGLVVLGPLLNGIFWVKCLSFLGFSREGAVMPPREAVYASPLSRAKSGCVA